LSLSSSSSSLLSLPFAFLLFDLFGNTTKTAPLSALRQRHGNFRFYDLSLSSSLSSLLSLPFAFFFFILFGNTKKSAPVSALRWRHGNIRFHDLSLSSSPSPRLCLSFAFFFPLPGLVSLFPSPFSFQFFMATLPKQRRCRRYNTLSTAPVSALRRCHGNFKIHDLSLSSSLSCLLSLPFAFSFSILFGNTTITAPVSALRWRHGNIRSHDLSLSSSLSPRVFLPFAFLFSATPRNQRRCLRFAGVTAISDLTN